jgi:antitoxin MazE
MRKPIVLTLQKWGNSLAVRIPAALSRSLHFKIGQPVELVQENDQLIIFPVGEPKLTLRQKLDLFDPIKHGGEIMDTQKIGKEEF